MAYPADKKQRLLAFQERALVAIEAAECDPSNGSPNQRDWLIRQELFLRRELGDNDRTQIIERKGRRLAEGQTAALIFLISLTSSRQNPNLRSLKKAIRALSSLISASRPQKPKQPRSELSASALLSSRLVAELCNALQAVGIPKDQARAAVSAVADKRREDLATRSALQKSKGSDREIPNSETKLRKRIAVGETKLWQYWKGYKDVVHLHAALWLFRKLGIRIEFDPQQVIEFLSLAEKLRKMGCIQTAPVGWTCSKSGEEFLLNESRAWRSPEDLSLYNYPDDLELPPLKEEVIRALESASKN
jgi:hypothetical protein